MDYLDFLCSEMEKDKQREFKQITAEIKQRPLPKSDCKHDSVYTSDPKYGALCLECGIELTSKQME